MVCVLGAVVFVVVAVLAAGTLCWRHEPFNVQLNPIGGMVGSLPEGVGSFVYEVQSSITKESAQQ